MLTLKFTRLHFLNFSISNLFFTYYLFVLNILNDPGLLVFTFKCLLCLKIIGDGDVFYRKLTGELLLVCFKIIFRLCLNVKGDFLLDFFLAKKLESCIFFFYTSYDLFFIAVFSYIYPKPLSISIEYIPLLEGGLNSYTIFYLAILFSWIFFFTNLKSIFFLKNPSLLFEEAVNLWVLS